MNKLCFGDNLETLREVDDKRIDLVHPICKVTSEHIDE